MIVLRKLGRNSVNPSAVYNSAHSRKEVMKNLFSTFVLAVVSVLAGGCALSRQSQQRPPVTTIVTVVTNYVVTTNQVFVYDQKAVGPAATRTPVENWPGGTGEPGWYKAPAQDAPATAASVQQAAPTVQYQYTAPTVYQPAPYYRYGSYGYPYSYSYGYPYYNDYVYRYPYYPTITLGFGWGFRTGSYGYGYGHRGHGWGHSGHRR